MSDPRIYSPPSSSLATAFAGDREPLILTERDAEEGSCWTATLSTASCAVGVIGASLGSVACYSQHQVFGSFCIIYSIPLIGCPMQRIVREVYSNCVRSDLDQNRASNSMQ